jgi:hypothetical protein
MRLPMPMQPQPEPEQEWEDDPELDELQKRQAWRFGNFLRLDFNPQDAAALMASGADWHAASDLLERGASHDVVKRILL